MAENAEMVGEVPHKGLQYTTCQMQTAEEMNCDFEFSNRKRKFSISANTNTNTNTFKKGVQYTCHLQTTEEMKCIFKGNFLLL